MFWKPTSFRKFRCGPLRLPDVLPRFADDHLLRDAGFVRDRVRPPATDPYLPSWGGR